MGVGQFWSFGPAAFACAEARSLSVLGRIVKGNVLAQCRTCRTGGQAKHARGLNGVIEFAVATRVLLNDRLPLSIVSLIGGRSVLFGFGSCVHTIPFRDCKDYIPLIDARTPILAF